MQIYEAKFGISQNIVEDRWLVRAKDFKEAATKATKTASEKAEGYTHSNHDLVSLTLLGREE